MDENPFLTPAALSTYALGFLLGFLLLFLPGCATDLKVDPIEIRNKKESSSAPPA